MVQWLRIHLPMKGTGSIPGQGTRIPHATGQLSLPATTTEPSRSGDCTPQLQSPHVLEPAPQLQSPCAPEPMCHNQRAHVPQLLSLCTRTRENPTHCNKEPLHCNERSHMPQLGPRHNPKKYFFFK